MTTPGMSLKGFLWDWAILTENKEFSPHTTSFNFRVGAQPETVRYLSYMICYCRNTFYIEIYHLYRIHGKRVRLHIQNLEKETASEREGDSEREREWEKVSEREKMSERENEWERVSEREKVREREKMSEREKKLLRECER